MGTKADERFSFSNINIIQVFFITLVSTRLCFHFFGLCFRSCHKLHLPRVNHWRNEKNLAGNALGVNKNWHGGLFCGAGSGCGGSVVIDVVGASAMYVALCMWS